MREVSPQNTICIDSQPSRPDAAIVGKPGASGDGCALVTASARNLPDLRCGATVPAVAIIM